MNRFEYSKPSTLAEALELLTGGPDETAILAGGTDLLALMKDYIVAPSRLVDVKDIRELAGINADDGGLRLGATATLEDLVRSPDVAARYRALHQAAEGVSSPQVRNRGTVAGDLCQKPRCWYFPPGIRADGGA